MAAAREGVDGRWGEHASHSWMDQTPLRGQRGGLNPCARVEGEAALGKVEPHRAQPNAEDRRNLLVGMTAHGEGEHLAPSKGQCALTRCTVRQRARLSSLRAAAIAERSRVRAASHSSR